MLDVTIAMVSVHVREASDNSEEVSLEYRVRREDSVQVSFMDRMLYVTIEKVRFMGRVER